MDYENNQSIKPRDGFRARAIPAKRRAEDLERFRATDEFRKSIRCKKDSSKARDEAEYFITSPKSLQVAGAPFADLADAYLAHQLASEGRP
jgi:hypothetical protein